MKELRWDDVWCCCGSYRSVTLVCSLTWQSISVAQAASRAIMRLSCRPALDSSKAIFWTCSDRLEGALEFFRVSKRKCWLQQRWLFPVFLQWARYGQLHNSACFSVCCVCVSVCSYAGVFCMYCVYLVCDIVFNPNLFLPSLWLCFLLPSLYSSLLYDSRLVGNNTETNIHC